MKIGIVGGRDFNDYDLLKYEITKFIVENKLVIQSIVSGGAKGTDTLAEKLASELETEMIVFKPNYEQFGRGAALARNTQIIENSDVVFAFWDGKSRGTHDSIKKAEKLGKNLMIIYYQEVNGKFCIMRDPRRIKPFLEKIEELWLKNPDFRFGQLIVWIAKSQETIPQFFYMEETDFLKNIKELEK